MTAIQLRHEFGEELAPGIHTPTDYLRLQVTVLDPSRSGADPIYKLEEDYALLLENEWLVPLPDVLEEAEGAAPDELLIYYSDMFPSRRAGPGSEPWLQRSEISAFVGSQFVPAAVDAFRLQADAWGFPWYQAWTSHSSEAKPKQLVVALAPSGTWYHGPAPENGHAGIAINVDTAGTGYETLLDGVMSTFHHELFHNLQRGLYQHFGLQREGPWGLVTEGMAVLASAVAQPDVQFDATARRRAYLATFRAFVGEEGADDGNLNRSYTELAYEGAAYWRFLYEQCAVGEDGVEDAAAGMGVMRRVLEVLYGGDAAHHLSPVGFVHAFPGIMDQALSGSPCPFQSYEQSLLAFARAVYALRLESEACAEAGFQTGCALHDPVRLYPRPAAEVIRDTRDHRDAGRSELRHLGDIASSYGIDLLEIVLGPAEQGRPLTVALRGSAAGAAEFRLEVWKLIEGDQRILPAAAVPERATVEPGGVLSYTLPEVDTQRYNRLGLIITRVDNEERRDRSGSYTLSLH